MRFILSATLFLSLAWPASAECKTWSHVVAYQNSYVQTQVTQGIMGASAMAVFVNPVTDIWTVTRQTPLGCTSIFAQGIGWRWLSRRHDSE